MRIKERPLKNQLGTVAWILHAHFPYMRQVGPWPAGEESLHLATAEAYLPLLATLDDLARAGLPIRVALAASPLLLEQLADPVVQKHAVLYLDAAHARAQADVARWEAAGEPHLAYLARFYADWHARAQAALSERFGRNLVAAMRTLVERGVVEPITGTATHCYLPALEAPGLARAQLAVGHATTIRRMGQPQALWVPELRPQPDLAEQLAQLGLRAVVLDGPADQPAPQPAWLDAQHRVLALFRDRPTAQLVISAQAGYPGDFVYREFYRRDPQSDLAYWRVSGLAVPQEHKELYDPYHALLRAQEHARHFVAAVEQRLAEQVARTGRPGLLVAAFDAELFGHGWFEGATWLRLVLETLAGHPAIRLATPRDLRRGPATQAVASPAPAPLSWDGPALADHWARINAAAARMERAAAATPAADGPTERALNQAVRELLLASGSDWPYLIATERASAYAAERLNGHLTRFAELLELASQAQAAARAGLPAAAALRLAEIEELDNPFPLLNYRIFCPEEARVDGKD